MDGIAFLIQVENKLEQLSLQQVTYEGLPPFIQTQTELYAIYTYN